LHETLLRIFLSQVFSYSSTFFAGLSFVHSAFKELLECRSILRYSYAYSFFKFESLAFKRRRPGKRAWNDLSAFEQLQSELETITEQMSDIVARSHLRANETQILFLTVSAAERRNDFSHLIMSLLKGEKCQQNDFETKMSESLYTAPVPATVTRTGNDGLRDAATGVGNDVQLLVREESAGGGREDLPLTRPVREALTASLEAFMANTDEEPSFVSQVNPDSECDEGEDADGNENCTNDNNDDDDTEAFEDNISWACAVCTYVNTGGRHCAMCGTLPSTT